MYRNALDVYHIDFNMRIVAIINATEVKPNHTHLTL